MRRLALAVAGLISSGCVGVVEEFADSGHEMQFDSGVEVDAGVVIDDDAGVFDAGQPDAGSPDSGTPDAGLISVFVALGKQQRRAISCDDGRTWVNDVSVDDAWPMNERYRCFSGTFALPDGGSNNTDCDHNAYSVIGLTYGDGVFVHTMGWGTPGTVWRSENGADWERVIDNGPTATDVMFDEHRFIMATRNPRRSDDQGRTWQSNPEIPVESNGNTIWNIRGGIAGGGVFLALGLDGQNIDMQRSTDRGATWSRPTLVGGGRVDACGAGHPVFGNGIFVTVRNDQGNTTVCRSSDGAQTWSTTTLNNVSIESRIVFTGTEFVMWSPGGVHRSADGTTWTSMPSQTRSSSGATSGGPNIGAVAYANGTFVAVRGGWQVWYEQQKFYRSTDGVVWDELPAGAFKPGHPITAMAAGLVPRSAACP